jgi:hypothetical protein
MLRRLFPVLIAGVLLSGIWSPSAARAQAPVPAVTYQPPPAYQPLNRFFYYPYYFFPHNYWPTLGPQWPEPIGQPYMRPPAYMAYPPFREPHWRYEWWEPQSWHRGFHFWLDQF